MAAGLETPQDTRGYENPVGKLIKKVLVARQLAEDERSYAEKKALEQGVTLEELGIKRGHFFKKALKHEFGGEAIGKKISKVKGVAKNLKLANKIKNNPKAIGALLKRKFINVEVDRKKAKSFRKLFDYTDPNPSVKPVSKKIPSTAKKIKKATTGRTSRISREELLSTFNVLIDSLNKTAERLANNSDNVSSGIMRASVAQAEIAEQLKVRNNSIEDRLDSLINAINNQTQFQKQTVDLSEDYARKEQLAEKRDIAASETPDNLSTKINESSTTQTITPTTSITNIQNIGVGSSREAEMKQMEAYGYPQAERGGIFSGPETGYLAQLHGDEMVVPLRNRYTEGKPSAVDGIRRPKPYETGTRYSPVGGRMGFGVTNMMGIAGGGTTASSKLSQPLVDAMSLVTMTAGGATLAKTTEMMRQMGGTGENINPEIEKVARPIADSFGLPASLTRKAKSGLPKKGRSEKDSLGKKDIIARLTEGFAKLLESFGKKVDEIPAPPPGAPGPGGTAQPADISGNEKELLKRLMIAEAGGEGIEGMAMVGRSVLNRAGLVQSGKLGAGQFNALSGSVTDIIQAPMQYQPYAQGKLNRALSAEENTRAEEAYQLMMNDPEFRKAIKSKFKLSESDVKRAAAATGFRNYDAGASVDATQQVNEFIAGRHTFNTAGNVGLITPYSSATVAEPTPPQTPLSNPSLTAIDLGQQLTQYDNTIQPHVKKYFNVPGYGQVQAYKTATGFDFYNSNNQKINMKSNTVQAPKIIQAFEQYMQTQSIQSPDIDNRTSFFAPPSSQTNQSLQIAGVDSSISSPNIVALSLPSNQQSKTSSSALPASDDTMPGLNPLDGSGHYSDVLFS